MDTTLREHSFTTLQKRCNAFNKAMYGDNPRPLFLHPFAFVSHFIDAVSNNILKKQIEVGKPHYSPLSLMDGSFLEKEFPRHFNSDNDLESRIMVSLDFDALYMGRLNIGNYAQKMEDYLSQHKTELLEIIEDKYRDYFNTNKTKAKDYIEFEPTQILDHPYKYVPVVSSNLPQMLQDDIYAVLPLSEYRYS